MHWRAPHYLFHEVVRIMILPTEAPVSLYTDIWKWTICLWIRFVRRQNKVGFECQTIFDKGIKNGCPCIVEIRGTQGCALVGDPARAVGECRDVAKAQP